MQFLVLIEKGDSSFGASVPDLPGCIAVGETEDEALELITEAIQFHLEDLQAEGRPAPRRVSRSVVVNVPMAA